MGVQRFEASAEVVNGVCLVRGELEIATCPEVRKGHRVGDGPMAR